MFIFQKQLAQQKQLEEVNAAGAIRTLRDAVKSAVALQRDDLVAYPEGVTLKDASEFLPQEYFSGFRVAVRREGAKLSAIIVSPTSLGRYALDNLSAARISSMLGASGGFVPSLTDEPSSTASGTLGLWTLDMTEISASLATPVRIVVNIDLTEELAAVPDMMADFAAALQNSGLAVLANGSIVSRGDISAEGSITAGGVLRSAKVVVPDTPCDGGSIGDSGSGSTMICAEGKWTDASARACQIVTDCPTGFASQASACKRTYTAYCASGYALNGTLCQKSYAASCPSGYSKSGTTCSKTYGATGSSYIASYSCPSGYSLSGSTCSTTTTTTTSAIESESHCLSRVCGGSAPGCERCAQWAYSYSCPSGYSLSGSTCSATSTSTQAATPNYGTSYSCPSGGSLSDTTCTLTAALTCPSGGSLSGAACILSQTPTCNTGGSLSGAICTQTTADRPIFSNSCPFSTYASPPAPWRTLVSDTSGTRSNYVFVK
ncbi:hypothetical protein FACS1894186_2360 [Alphaproteobacteria bacterium]|nr:hypothetical protein FACS1894186_2360 [Alphaproteobacteria bacterium]